MSTKKRPSLISTNRHLQDSKKRLDMVHQSMLSSTAIEGVRLEHRQSYQQHTNKQKNAASNPKG